MGESNKESNIEKRIKLEIGETFKKVIEKLSTCRNPDPIVYRLERYIKATEILKADLPFYIEQLVKEETIEGPTKEPVIIEKVEIQIENKMDIGELKNKINTLEKVVSEIQEIIEGEKE